MTNKNKIIPIIVNSDSSFTVRKITSNKNRLGIKKKHSVKNTLENSAKTETVKKTNTVLVFVFFTLFSSMFRSN